jgi:phospholipid/cholesterol/gamma-HCH transport system substrate-binding protein
MRPVRRWPDALLGVGYLGLAALIVVAAMLAYNKTFVDRADLTLQTGTIGNALQRGSDVKLHGVPVGTVTKLETADGGATLTLGIKPSTLDELPVGTTARLLPKTLFGERFVSLVTPDGRSGRGGETLEAGGTIHQDVSDESVELEQVFDELLPLLQSINPDRLSASLGELATMLRGQGRAIGDNLAAWSDYLQKLNPKVPAMTDDLAKLASVAGTYNEALPDLLSALDTMTTTSATLVDQRTELSEVYATVIESADTSRGWVTKNQDTIEVLADESRTALEAAAPYAREFPCLFDAARRFIPAMDKTLGEGTTEPGIHVKLNVTDSRGKYVAGKDKPTFTGSGKPRCPYVTGRTGTQPAGSTGSTSSSSTASTASTDDAAEPDDEGEPAAIPAPPSNDLAQATAATGLGPANSVGENTLIAELLAPTQGMAPQDYPKWASLLVGPTLRNAKVTLQ